MRSAHEGSNAFDASRAGTFALGGDMAVNRLGFGAMRIPGVWDEEAEKGRALLRRAVELGVNLIDTAEYYGPEVSERLIAEALYPYRDGLVIATKGLIPRTGPPGVEGRLRLLRETVEGSLRRLRLERIDLYQLARIDPTVPAEDQFGTLADLRSQGKVRHVGLSEVRTDEIEAARRIVPVVSVQNRYNLADRAWEGVLDHCERKGLGFLPWFPLGEGKLAGATGALVEIAKRHHATPAQIALSWLLRRSPVMLPIPGTSSVAHLEENVAAAAFHLDDDEFSAASPAT